MDSSKQRVVIVSACRTPIGSLNGTLSTLKASELGSIVIKESLARAKISPAQVSEVIIGQVLTSGQGQNPARQASIGAGLPHTVPATLVSMVCGSGLRAVMMGAQAIQTGDAEIVVAGGQESMSQAHHSSYLRAGVKFGNLNLEDTILVDGLTDAFNHYHMGITAENLSTNFNINRTEQDEFACESQKRYAVFETTGGFKDEIVPVVIESRKGKVEFSVDEFPRKQTSLEGLGKLRPAFKSDGTVTAGNASGVNDGAAAVVLTSASMAKESGLESLGELVSFALAGVDPSVMGLGPVPAIKKALEKSGWGIEDVDLFELNEAFAAQSVAVIRELGLDSKKVNVNGGAIALGHPIGASGTRILVSLLYELRRSGKRKGVAALCIGGGMGIAVCVERN